MGRYGSPYSLFWELGIESEQFSVEKTEFQLGPRGIHKHGLVMAMHTYMIIYLYIYTVYVHYIIYNYSCVYIYIQMYI